jgi:hypothetical protein
MKSKSHSIRLRFGRRAIMVGIIVCLCLSAGEGLRLRPFPVYELGNVEPTYAKLHAENSTNPYLYGHTNKYNPIVAPARPVKRGKQQEIHYDHGSPSSYIRREVPVRFKRLPATCEAERIVFLLLSSRTPSRAPPAF